MTEERRYWFPAKKFGWGWGWPCRPQGWAVLIAFFVLLALGVIWFPPDRMVFGYIAYVSALSALLCLICWRTGEPPRWRGGK
ncbi:hypothetical protein [Viridibacterium curvum]|uniref:DUF4175 domain-containing protein n=1 Tax=Viridibacterium curvum TaxID=1101404 RepID=A0ABP9QNW7_9RHOO